MDFKNRIKWKIKKLVNLSMPDRWFFVRGNKHKPIIYLTYDDGPDPAVTPLLLDLLDRYDAKATFFVIGSKAEKYPELIQDIFNRGHIVANHSYYHRNYTGRPKVQQLKEIDKTNDRIFSITKSECTLFRFPQGKLSFKVFVHLIFRKMCVVHWTRDSNDCRNDPKDVIAGIKDNPLNKGDIVLMHDDGIGALEVTDFILNINKGEYEFQLINPQ